MEKRKTRIKVAARWMERRGTDKRRGKRRGGVQFGGGAERNRGTGEKCAKER